MASKNSSEGSWNDDIEEDIDPTALEKIVVFSRDWTVETIVSQIEKGNIDLEPKFQRRNAWNDARRSRLIESLVINAPVPEIVLAEDPSHRNSFLVIDGKQRLMAVAGFVKPEIYSFWYSPKLSGLKVRRDLNGKTFREISDDDRSDVSSKLMNADVRCTVISGYKKPDVLYDIFYRLNTGSVPLSAQELRQVLHKGPFAEWLINYTNVLRPIHPIIGCDGPDERLRDVELVLRFIAFDTDIESYKGNLKKFLDDTMRRFNSDWVNYEAKAAASVNRFEKAIERLTRLLSAERVDRKYTNKKWETIFNKALFEVQAYYFARISTEKVSKADSKLFLKEFQKLCQSKDFLTTIESTTKSTENYRTRYSMFGEFLSSFFDTSIKPPAIG